jgi:alcohol dehydrogenase, propanol-preferring
MDAAHQEQIRPMNAMVLQRAERIEREPLQFKSVPTPVAEANQIRIRIRACGVCHTDLHIIEGEIILPKVPIIPGHQIVGVIDQVGAGVSRFNVGDRVGVPWLNWTDGACGYCANGEENLCESARFTGLHVNGGYAEFTTVDENFAYKIPEAFTDMQAAPLLCAGAVGYRALRLSDLKPGERLGIFGFGASGHIALQVARHLGSQVYVFTRGEEHRKLAQKLGAAWTGHAGEKPPNAIDRAVIFAPIGTLVLDALAVLRKGGTVAHAGIYSTPIPQIPYNLLYQERTIRSVTNSTRQDVEDLLQIAAQIPVQIQFDIFPLKDANRALKMMKASQLKASAVLEISN